MNEITTAAPQDPPLDAAGQEIVSARQADLAPIETPSLISVIERAARDPSIDIEKMQALLAMQERIVAREAQAEFNAALARLLPKMPRITKRGVIDTGKGKIPFAKWEDIDRVIRPLLTEEGFALSFSSRPGTPTAVTGKLLHRAGHFETAELALPPDAGPGRNGLQAVGSSFSYSQRYIAKLLLNLVFEGEDDDGHAGGTVYVSDKQLSELQREASDRGVDLEKFCRVFMVEALSRIEARDFEKALNWLRQKSRKAGAPT